VLASTDWTTQKVTLGSAEVATLSAEERQSCASHFYDSDGIFNFFWRLGPFIAEISQQAKRDLKMLDAMSDPYEAVFGKCSSLELKWDLVIRLPALGVEALCPDIAKNFRTPDALGKARAADLPEAMALGSHLAAALKMGLGDRCTHVAIRLVGEPSLCWHKQRPTQGATALVGCLLDAMHIDRILDRGPSAQEANATQFRNFWGSSKSEMRRFKDGSILECVAWAKPPPDRSVESKKQPAIVTQIVKHVLSQHFSAVAADAVILSGPLGFVPNLPDSRRHLWQSFEEFRSNLMQLSSLPITIKDVRAAGSAFTYTDVSPELSPPAADGIARTIHPVIVEFESSGRWPDKPEAARKVCTALLLQMRQELLTDSGIESDVTEDFLDVRYPEFVFRVRVFHQYELTATAHHVTNFQAQAGKEAPDAISLDRLRILWWCPRLVANLHAQVLQRPALAGTVRLCKQWVASQMLSGYDDFIEHLAASVFLHPAPFDVPTSPQVGFCRVCWLLDTFDWSHEPLIIDWDGKLSEEERLAMRRSFENSRDSGSSKFFWISSRFDPHAMLLATPPATVSAWLQKRARQAIVLYGKKLIGVGGSDGNKNDWQDLFALDTSIFDLLIRLTPPGEKDAAKARKGVASNARRRAMAMREAEASLVEKIRLHLSSVCIIFHNGENHMVGLKWRPDAFLPQHQNVLMGSVPHTMLQQGKDGQPLCIPNVLCLTSVISSLADGMAVDVRVVGME
jgi:U3 small nucleolar RNA-associated protein 22